MGPGECGPEWYWWNILMPPESHKCNITLADFIGVKALLWIQFDSHDEIFTPASVQWTLGCKLLFVYLQISVYRPSRRIPRFVLFSWRYARSEAVTSSSSMALASGKAGGISCSRERERIRKLEGRPHHTNLLLLETKMGNATGHWKIEWRDDGTVLI